MVNGVVYFVIHAAAAADFETRNDFIIILSFFSPRSVHSNRTFTRHNFVLTRCVSHSVESNQGHAVSLQK